jgi:hypothetical protein
MIDPAITLTPEDFLDSLQPLAAELGPQAVLALVRHFGGTRLYVPRVYAGEGALAVLGDEAEALCGLFGGTRIEVPKEPFRREFYVRWVATLRGQGRTTNEVARALGVGYRFVQEIAAGAPVTPRAARARDPRQMDLL